MLRPTASFFLPVLFLFLQIETKAQSADSRICNCFTTALPSTFMEATKVIYGTIGVVVKREEELKPAQSQPVRFSIPKLTPKQGCGAVYNIIIRDEAGTIVYEDEDSHNEFSYTFPECGKRYDITLTASARSTGDNDGNCSRSIHFYIKPVCNTQTCSCDPPASGKNIGTSINLKVEGKLICGITTATRRTYTFQYQFTNKTRCRMVIESITVLGETLSGGSAAMTAAGKSTAYNTSISTALSTAAPTGTSVNITVRYKVNDRSCTATLKMPYTSCR